VATRPAPSGTREEMKRALGDLLRDIR
jgi:hypothetical protein